MRHVCASAETIDNFASGHHADDYIVFTRGNVTAIALVSPVLPDDPNDYHRRCRDRSLIYASPECAYYEIYVHFNDTPHDSWLFLTYGRCVSYSSIFDSFREAL